jgi:CspA family cold shock protein
MATGTVKWFNQEKGFGFIIPDKAGSEMFVHVTALRDDMGVTTLSDGQKVSYEVGSNKGRSCAVDVQVLS